MNGKSKHLNDFVVSKILRRWKFSIDSQICYIYFFDEGIHTKELKKT